jgi:hypothetical protein
MDTSNRKGIFGKWFKVNKTGCCDVKIEEIKDDEENKDEAGLKKEEINSTCGKKPKKPCCS